MRCLALIIGLILGLNCFSQEPQTVSESSEMNILYRGYQNRVIPDVPNPDGRAISLSSANASISYSKSEEAFIVVPKKGKTVELSISLKDDDGKIEVIETVEYQLANLPVPNIYWGDMVSGGNGNIKSQCLSVKYPIKVPFESEFRILSWETSFEKETVSGDGSSLSAGEAFFKKIPSGTTLLFEVVVQSADGIRHIRKAHWTVMSWGIEKDIREETGCE